jgi:hypothetical protein
MTAHWERCLTGDDVDTARRIAPMHRPLDEGASATVCAHAGHRITPAAWPCREAVWAQRVVDAAERGEITR